MDRFKLEILNRSPNQLCTEFGVTIIELLVSVSLSLVVFGGLVQQYSTGVTLSYDESVRIATILEAQAMLQTLGLEFRMIGNGVPFDQANFQIGESTLTDPTVTEPLDVVTATASNITFRLNESGDVYLLSADFDPASSLVISLTDTSNLDINDPIYISNSVVSGDDGLYGVITAVDDVSKTVTIDANYVASPGSTFDMGSILEEVPEITYTSSGGSITRNSGFGAVLLGDNSAMELEYLDMNGNVLSLPLTNADVVNALRAIRVTITHTSSRKLKSGGFHSTTVGQVFGIRNLNYVY